MEKSTIRAGAADLFSFMAHIPVILLMFPRFFRCGCGVCGENNNPSVVDDAGPLEKCSPAKIQRELLRTLKCPLITTRRVFNWWIMLVVEWTIEKRNCGNKVSTSAFVYWRENYTRGNRPNEITCTGLIKTGLSIVPRSRGGDRRVNERFLPLNRVNAGCRRNGPHTPRPGLRGWKFGTCPVKGVQMTRGAFNRWEENTCRLVPNERAIYSNMTHKKGEQWKFWIIRWPSQKTNDIR